MPTGLANQYPDCERAARTPKGEVIRGFKYDDTKTREGRRLTKADLDAVAPAHPVVIIHRGMHTAYVNSRMFEVSDINAKTPNPVGGMMVHDEAGNLTGELRETAIDIFKGPTLAYSRDDRREGVKLITQLFAKAGVTTTHAAQGTPLDLRAYQDAHEEGQLSCRVYTLINFRFIDAMIAAGVRTGFGNDWCRVGAMKLVSDGSISERTARLRDPYIGRKDDHGIQVMSEAELYEYARKAHLAGWQIGTHANGDEGIDGALRVYERLQKESPRRDPRFRLEHCTMVNDGLLDRIKAGGGEVERVAAKEFEPMEKSHVKGFLASVRSRQRPAADVEEGHRTATMCHLGNLSMRLGRSLRWNAAKEQVEGDAEANMLLRKAYRAPWKWPAV